MNPPTANLELTQPADTDGLLFALRDEITVISPDRSRVASFDREGRMVHLFRDGLTFKRGMDSRLHLRFQDAGRQRRVLNPIEMLEVFAEVTALAQTVHRQAPGELRERLEHEVLQWAPAKLEAEATRFHEAYPWPISILPPDSYLNVVVQATFACTWNQCTFCNFYQDRKFRVRHDDDFCDHLERVKHLFGRGLSLRKGVFLADGNALALLPKRLMHMLELVNRAFTGQPIFGFVDVFTANHHQPSNWAALRALGLKRVYIGMETGSDEVLRFINKPGSCQMAHDVVSSLKQAGVQVGLIFMVGLGGLEHRESHRQASLEAIRAMPLGAGDIVYLSPFVEHADSEYARRRFNLGLHPMTEAEVQLELEAFSKDIRTLGLKAARYDIREFIY